MADDLKQQVDEGIATHKAMARDLQAWLYEIFCQIYGTSCEKLEGRYLST